MSRLVGWFGLVEPSSDENFEKSAWCAIPDITTFVVVLGKIALDDFIMVEIIGLPVERSFHSTTSCKALYDYYYNSITVSGVTCSLTCLLCE